MKGISLANRRRLGSLLVGAAPAFVILSACQPALAQLIQRPGEAMLFAPNRIAATPPAFLTDASGGARLDLAVTNSIAAATQTAPAASAPASAAILRHLPNNIPGFRLEGETGASEWPIYLSERQAQSNLRFRVGYLSAVSVMPEASILTVTVNDVTVGTTRIEAPNKVQSVDFDIPRELVKPGFNAVRIAVDQRHRVDCTVGATYELWTQIDPSQTGVVTQSGAASVQDIADLAALPPDEQGALPVRAVLPGRTSAANIERMIRAVQLIASVGHFDQPTVDLGGMAGGDYGVNLVVGLYEDVTKTPDLEGLGMIDGPRVALLPATSTRRSTIVITGQTEDEVNRALTAFGEHALTHGSEAGLRAASAFPGYRVSGGQSVSLRDLGAHSQEFSGHFFRTGFNIVMPSDFYSADYAKVPLDLAGGYAAGLARNAQIIVSINGRNAVSAALPRAQGAVFKENTLPLPLSYFHPGLNRIEIAAELPAVGDAACDPLAVVANKKRFLFLDSTRIRIPDLARIGRAPDLAVTATGGFPYIGGGRQPKLYVPAPDRNSIGAAATLAGRMAAAAGRPIDFRFTTTPPPIGSGATLVVASAAALDDAIASAVGLDPSMLRKAWSDRSLESEGKTDEKLSDYELRARNRLVLQKNLPAACHLKRRPTLATEASEPASLAPLAESLDRPGEAKPRDLFAEWSKQNDNDGILSRWLDAAGQKIGAATSGAYARTLDDARRLFPSEVSDAPSPIYKQENTLVIAQAALSADTSAVWTVVVAPNSKLLAESVNCLSDPRVWSHIEGRIAMLDDSYGKLTSLPAGQLRFVATQPLSVSNIRLIAAGWLSINSGAYVALALALALILSIATFTFVRNVGRREE